MVIDVEGIIIDVKNYGDTSKILTIFTKEYGMVGVIAKGCKNIKSPLRSVTNILSYATFTIYYKKDKLSILSEASIINNFSSIKKDLEKLSYASYILDLANQVYKENNDSNIYDLLINTLIKINEGYNVLALTNILELKYLQYLGVMPNLDGCTICGNKNVVTLSGSQGGFLCSKCHRNEPIISNQSLKLIRMYYYIDIKKISKFELSKEYIYEINNFLNDYYDRYTGLYLKSKTFLNKINELK